MEFYGVSAASVDRQFLEAHRTPSNWVKKAKMDYESAALTIEL
jgi:hypothetical protein